MQTHAQRRQTSRPGGGSRQPITDEMVWQAIAVVGVVVAAPLAVAIAAMTWGLVRAMGLRTRWALAPAVVGSGWLALVGPVAVAESHLAIYAQLPEAGSSALPELAATRWPAWLAAMAPLSLVAGGLVAAGISVYGDWRRPDWQGHEAEAKPRPRKARRRAHRLRQNREPAPVSAWRRRDEAPLLTLGVDLYGEPVGLSRQQLAEHALLVGATGSGKTTSQLRLCAGAIRGRYPLVMLDCKGTDAELADRLTAEAGAAGRPVYRWGVDGPTRWNPLARGDATRLKDKLVSGEEWSEPHYQRVAERHLQWVLRLLLARPGTPPPTLGEVVRYAEPDATQRLTRDVSDELAEAAQSYLDRLDGRAAKDLHGAISRLGNVSESIAGPWLEPDDQGWALDLHTALREQAVVLFQLPTGDYPEVCAQVAGMALIDLQTVAAQLQRDGWGGQAFVAVDEFSALQGTHLLGLLARGRSAGLSVLLATQELADLQTSRPEFADQVIANTSVKLAHRVDVPDSAERLAGMAGTYRTWEATHQVHERTRRARADEGTGFGSVRAVDEYRVHPNTIKELPRGRALLLTKQPRTDVRLVDVVAAPAPTLKAVQATGQENGGTSDEAGELPAPPPDVEGVEPRTPPPDDEPPTHVVNASEDEQEPVEEATG